MKYKCFHITEKHGEKVDSYMVCEDCLYLSATSKIKMADEDLSCGTCGMRLEEILKGSRMGCAKCYDRFEKTLDHVIKAVQIGGGERHVGRIPDQWKRLQAEAADPVKFLTELKQKYRISLKSERYDKASFLNEKIIDFEKLLVNYEKRRAPSVKRELADMIYHCRESELF
jgi:protein-arginine kinase activator protein McsA